MTLKYYIIIIFRKNSIVASSLLKVRVEEAVVHLPDVSGVVVAFRVVVAADGLRDDPHLSASAVVLSNRRYVRADLI